MSDFNVIYNIIAQDKFSRIATQIKNKTSELHRSIKSLGKGIKDTGKFMTTRFTLPLGIMGGVALKQAANIETMQVSLESMTGSTEKASALMKDLIQFTATTPFQLEGVGAATKTLLAFKVSQKEMIPTLRMLGDIAAGTNAPLTDIAKIFGKAKAKGKLMTEELLQLAERGIPVIDVLAEGFGVTKAKVFEMASKSQISFDVMQKALAKTTSKGGVFFKQTEKQSRTLAGVFSTLKDNAGLAFAELGTQLVKTFNLKEKIISLTKTIAGWAMSFKNFAEAHPVITKIIFVLIGLLAVAGPILVVIGSLVTMIPFLVAGFSALAIATNAAALPVLAVVAGIAAAWFIGKKLKSFLEGFPAVWHAIGAAINVILNPLDSIAALFDKIMSFNFGGLMSKIGGIFGGGNEIKSKIGGVLGDDVNATSTSRSTVDVNLNAPQGAVKSIKSRSSGATNFNLGTNMLATAQ